MLPNKLKSPLGILRLAIVILGLLILIIGCVSHYKSDWVLEKWCLTMRWNGMSPVTHCGTFRENVCELIAKHLNKPCPSLTMEGYFVAMVIICFVLSLIALFVFVIVNVGEGLLKKVDLGYHCISAILLLIAAIVYLVSTNQIESLTRYISKGDINMKRNEKVAAASLTFIQVCLHAVVALHIARG